ncbi:MAG: phospholipase D-like domain-containing protein [Acidobacteriota bacterium]|nr:phospholipase D-like domain-containing protein [Acidobacteriota bacterium]
MKEKVKSLQQSAPELEQLHHIRQQSHALPPGVGILVRLRRYIWRVMLWLLLQIAQFSWKRWLVVGLLALLAIVGFLFNPIEESPEYGLNYDFAIESAEFLPSISGSTDTPFLPGNKIEIYNNGDQFYPPMLDAINQARSSVTIEAYIYWAGEIGKKFAGALAAKRREGKSVKILLDAVGSSTISDEILNMLKNAGCEVRWYHPLHWYSLNRVNNRTHRKSLIIDGRVGFTGGAGIADHWVGNAENPDHWRDIQIRLEGPAVATLQSAFTRNWLETTGELISGDAFFPQINADGPMAVQSILSSPETGSSTVRIMYYLSIVCARRSILIANPYFIPDAQATRILIDAKRRGVDVKIMVAGIHNDTYLARYNTTRLYGPLLEAGVEIYEYNRTMLHQKFMVCDGVWATVGTTNFDSRSFALNDENNVCVYGRDFAAKWEAIFRDDLPACQRVTLEGWRNRGLRTRLGEALFFLLRSQV